MELTSTQFKPNPLHFYPDYLILLRRTSIRVSPYRCCRPKLSRRKGIRISASSSGTNPSEPEGFSWLQFSQSIGRGSQRFFQKFGESVKKETGFSIEDAKVSAKEVTDQFQVQFGRVNSELLPQFINWNKWDYWKDIKKWEPKRVGVLVLYIFVVVLSCRGAYNMIRSPIIQRERKELAEAYMEALIPEPTPTNVRQNSQDDYAKTALISRTYDNRSIDAMWLVS